MDKVRLYLVAGAFALGVILTLAVVYAFIDRGSSAASTLPVQTVPISQPVAEVVQDSTISPADVEHGSKAGASDGFGEGIKVHGDWTIDVHEADGTLVSHNEFENALLGTGARRIAEIIGRRMVPRYWGIDLRHSTLSNSPCLSSSNEATSCIIYEPQGTVASFTSNNLVVTTTTDGILRLSGSITAQRDGQINGVKTRHSGQPCAEGVSFPDGCAGSAGTEVTNTTLPTAIVVSEGQSISATVEISFE